MPSTSVSAAVTSCSISEQPGVENIDGINDLTTHETGDKSKIDNISLIVVARKIIRFCGHSIGLNEIYVWHATINKCLLQIPPKKM